MGVIDFNPDKWLARPDDPSLVAKVAKAAKVEAADRPSLATLAALAGDPVALEHWRSGLARLDHWRPRGGIDPQRWRVIHGDAVAIFNDWAGQAAGLGWSAADLFGVNLSRSDDDRQGLAWRLQGRRVFAMTAASASSRPRWGDVPVMLYRGDASGRVPLWELPL